MSTIFTHVDLGDTLGALQIGSIFSVFLFGVVTLQAYVYYSTFREDLWIYKALVTAICLLEVGHTAAVCYEVYHDTITLYGQPQLLGAFPVLGAVTAIGGAITFLVQGFFAMRLFRVLPKPYGFIGILCLVLSLSRCVASIYLSIQAVAAKSIAQYHLQMSWLISTLLAVGAAIDIIIAVSMLYYLSKKRGRGLERIATVIDRLIAYTIRTGLLTSVSAVVLLICFQTMPNNLVWLALYTFLAKLYSNSLLSALNARQGMREEASLSTPSGDRHLRSKNTRRDNMNPSRVAFEGIQAISIEMKTTTETIQDDPAFYVKPGSSVHYHRSANQKV